MIVNPWSRHHYPPPPHPECVLLPDPPKVGSTCNTFENKCLYVREGDALYVVPDPLQDKQYYDQQHIFTWHRKQGNTSVSSSEEERIHHHGPALFFLPFSVNDSDLYIAR